MVLEKNSFEEKILDCLMSNNYGLTVVAIAKIIGASRNTIYRYLDILVEKDLIFRKEIGRYNLYFSKEGRQIDRDLVASFYKGLLIAFSNEISDSSHFKNVGRTISEYVQLPFETEITDIILQSEDRFKKEFIEILGDIRPYISLLHDKIVLNDIILNEEEKRIVFHFVNSDMLEENELGLNHFYLLMGFVEEKIKSRFGLNVKCDIIDYKIAKKDNYIKLSLELIE